MFNIIIMRQWKWKCSWGQKNMIFSAVHYIIIIMTNAVILFYVLNLQIIVSAWIWILLLRLIARIFTAHQQKNRPSFFLTRLLNNVMNIGRHYNFSYPVALYNPQIFHILIFISFGMCIFLIYLARMGQTWGSLT